MASSRREFGINDLIGISIGNVLVYRVCIHRKSQKQKYKFEISNILVFALCHRDRTEHMPLATPTQLMHHDSKIALVVKHTRFRPEGRTDHMLTDKF